MKRALVSLNCFAAATLVMMSLSSAATAGTIYLDNSIGIYQYPATGGLGTSALLASSPGGIEDLAFTSSDMIVGGDVLLGAYDGTGLSGAGIYAYSQAGAFSLFASVVDPVGLAVGPGGNVYVGANGGTTIEELSPTGAFVKNIATGVDVQSLAVDLAGDIFEADGSGYVMEIPAGGGSPTKYSLTPLSGGNNFGTAVDLAGNVFVTYDNSLSTGGIDEISSTGALSNIYLGSILPEDVAYDPQSGNLYMSYLDSSDAPGGGIDVFVGESATPTSFATFSSGFPGAIADGTPEPGSILLLGGGLLLTSLLHFRRVRRLAQAARGRA
jgi:photosystem II stability/assembly factor-like uncharacterized protein